MPCAWTKSDQTAARCPVCGLFPAVVDLATDKGRTVTYRCQRGHLSVSGEDNHKARGKWVKAVRLHKQNASRVAKVKRV